MILWLPKGALIRSLLESFVREELTRRGYEAVYTPNIGKIDLYKISGHFPYYADSQFKPIFETEAGPLVASWLRKLKANELTSDEEDVLLGLAEKMGARGELLAAYKAQQTAAGRIEVLDQLDREQETYLLKPMNCPHHIMIYKSKPRSYRDLPVRLAEFGTVYRYEQSGELGGMTRVRGFTQDDAHLFCTAEQVEEEFRGCLEMTQSILSALGMTNYRVRLGFRDPASDKYVGSDENWRNAEAALEAVCRSVIPQFDIARGEAAFYGPKADFVVSDCLGREWQLGTVQLDYNLPSPERFALEYIGADNQPHRAGDDSPGAAGLAGAVRRRADRAFRRGVSALAGAGAGPDRNGQPKVGGVCPRGGAAVARGRAAGDGGLSGRKAGFQDPRRPIAVDSLHAGDRRAGRGAGNGGRPRPDRRRPGSHARVGGDRQAAGGSSRAESAASGSGASGRAPGGPGRGPSVLAVY